MSLLTYISGVPLFSTLIEAIEWGENRGLTGYHTHNYEGQTGYMGGATHPNSTRQTNSPAPTSSFSGSSSGGGGGY